MWGRRLGSVRERAKRRFYGSANVLVLLLGVGYERGFTLR